jgi:SAM-dependent methyltransferase
MPLRQDLHEENRQSWNEATKAHNSHKRDQAQFLRNGGDTLYPEELELLGDVTGLTLVHLQCNSGQDSLCLARRGAVVTGVDISDEAIGFARQLSADSGIPAMFERMDVYDWFQSASREGRTFDIAFSSYGAACWLSDIRLWAQGIAGILKPGGRFVLVEFHPAAMMLDDKSWTLKYPYFGDGTPYTWQEGIRDYVAQSGEPLTPSGWQEGVKDFINPVHCHEFQWTVSDLVTSFLDAGLVLTSLREYPYCNGDKLLADMRELPGKRMVPPEGVPSFPLMLGLAVRKPG